MGDKKQFRTEAARKNYETQERKRLTAIRRKARQAKQAAQMEQLKNWLKNNKAKAAAMLCAVVAVIVLVCVGVNVLTDPLKDKQDNWLILDVATSSKADQYRHLANFDAPTGYTRDSYSSYKDGQEQDFFYIADDAAATVQDVYVTGAQGIDAMTYPQTLLSYGLHKEAGEPRQLTINGMACSALYLISDESEWSGEGKAIAHMSFYFPTDSGVCISATLRSGTVDSTQLPDEATMLAEAEKLLSGLTILK